MKDGFTFAPELWPYSNYAGWVEERRTVRLDRAAAERKYMPDPLREYVAALE